MDIHLGLQHACLQVREPEPSLLQVQYSVCALLEGVAELHKVSSLCFEVIGSW